MAYALGVVLFAFAILVSVCLHEAGHMLTAKAFGMKVTKFFAGFGPTLWSFRRGETEYGLKGIPLGGFVKIVGMTPQDDDVAPQDESRAMWRFPVWKRTIVMSAGSVTHFILGFVLLWVVLTFIGVPNPALADDSKLPPTVKIGACVQSSADQLACQPSDPQSPAQLAGLKDGDEIISVNGKPVSSYPELVTTIRSTPTGPTTIVYKRDGTIRTTTATLVTVSRRPAGNDQAAPTQVSALGVTFKPPPDMPLSVTYGAVDSLGKAGQYTVLTFEQVFSALKRFPERIPAVWQALNGSPRDPNTPVSVVGASRLGGQSVELGSWTTFFALLISLNFFFGVFNLLPLLPMDGGHIAIAWFERLRSWLYALFRRPDPGHVDYAKLAPLTLVLVVLGAGLVLLTVAADIVNPITL
jgi:membrane-associated protease RseP (regulator of RpoE activity)